MSAHPTLGRRQAGGLAAGALAAATLPRTAFAADPRPSSAATACRPISTRIRSTTCRCRAMLNTYDGLYRYQNNPPQDRALAGREPHRLGGRAGLGVQAAAQRQVPRRQPADRRGRGLQLPPRAGAGAGAGQRLPGDPEAGERHGARAADGPLQAGTAYAPLPRRDSDRSPSSIRGLVKAEREGRRLGQGLARLERGGLRRLQHHPRLATPLEKLDMVLYEGHFLGWKDNPKPVPRRSPIRAAKETSTRILACSTARSTGPTATCRPTRSNRSTSPRSPTCRRTSSCGPSSSA